MSSPSSVPTTSSVSTTPKAPKRKRVRDFNLPYVPFEYDTFNETDSEEERQMVEAVEYMERRRRQDAGISQNWPIHRGYLRYTLEDVAMENSKDVLEHWMKLFSPSQQPWSEKISRNKAEKIPLL